MTTPCAAAERLDAQLLMHQVMLGDRVRLDAYDRALARAVRPGDVVADAGAGTLVLSFLALRHGARHVYAIEGDPATAALARAIAERNELAGRLTLIQDDVRAVRLPEPADVLVAEMMGNLGPEEEIAETLAAFAGANLRAGGRVVPQHVETLLQPVSFDGEGWGVWNDDVYGFSLRAVQDYAPACAQLHFFSRPPVLLGPPVAASAHGDPVLLELTAAGTLHAVIGYFRAALAPGVTLSNFPSYAGCNWAVWVWPVRHVAVSPGDALRVALRRPAGERDARDATAWTLDCGLARAVRR